MICMVFSILLFAASGKMTEAEFLMLSFQLTSVGMEVCNFLLYHSELIFVVEKHFQTIILLQVTMFCEQRILYCKRCIHKHSTQKLHWNFLIKPNFGYYDSNLDSL